MNLVNTLELVKCGNMEIDHIIPGTISMVVTILKIAIPIILIIFGMLDLSKAVMANDEKEMKEAQKKLIHRIIYAVVVFFVIALVQFVFSRLASQDSDGTNINKTSVSSCVNCFINDKCDPAK